MDLGLNLDLLGEITFENFHLFTKGDFLECERPIQTPDYESVGGSCYWYGADEVGEYVIRGADHWCQYHTIGSRKKKRFRARIRTCSWNISIPDGILLIETMRYGKCYLQDFQRIRWKTKRRYEINESY